MPYARDEAGNIWETDAAGNAIRLAQSAASAQPQPVTIGTPNQTKIQRDVVGLAGDQLTNQGRVLDNQVTQATAGATISKAQSDAARAAADADKARAEAAAAVKEQANAPDPATARTQAALQTDNVLSLLNTARSQIGNGWSTGNVAGTRGFQSVPWVGQNSTNLSGTLEGIQGNVINDVLKQLKAASANGSSGYGSLTESEGQRLAAAVASLKQTQDSETLFRNLAQVERHYRNSLALLNNEDPRDPAIAAKYGIRPPDGDRDGAAGLQNGNGGPPAGGSNGPNSGGPGGLTNQGRFIADPSLAGANATVRQMIERGGTPAEIRAYLDRLRPGYGSQVNGIEEAVADWRQNPSRRRELNIDLEKTWQPASGLSQTIGAVGMSPVGAALIGAGDIASIGTLDNIAGLAGGNAEQTRAVMTGVQQNSPNSYLAGQILGGVAGGLGLEGVLGRAGLGAARSALAGEAALGAGYGAGSADGPNEDRVTSALLGAASGAAGNVAGNAVARALGRGLSGVQGAVQTKLADAGVQMTPGQLLGGGIKRWEDRLAGFPLVGDAITARRREGVQDFNRAAFDEALSPINGTTGGQIAEPGAQAAQDSVSQAYRNALGAVAVQTDPQYVSAANALAQQVQQIPRVGGEVYDSMRTAIAPMIGPGGQITGDAMQDILQGVRTVGDQYRGNGFTAADPLYATHIAPAINDYTAILEALVERQAPGTIDALRAANAANRNVSTVGDAVIAAANRGGEFMPSQLMNASKANTKALSGKRSAAAGRGPLFDLARAGQEVLPSQVPDSGTAGRIVLPLLAGGALGGGTYATQDGSASDAAPSSLATGAIAAALLAAPYSRGATSALQAGLIGERPAAVARAGELLLDERTRRIAGLLGGAGAISQIGN